MSLPFRVIPARHRLGLIDEEMQQKIMRARHAFAENLSEELSSGLVIFEPDSYNNAANLQDNILFGKIAYGQAQAGERVGALIGELIEELDLKRVVGEVGLSFDVGIAGSRLSGEQRQKLALARAVIKRPDCLILSDVTASFDGASQARIQQNLLQAFEGRFVLWSLQRASLAAEFDSVLVMKQGRVVEFDSFEKLNVEGTHLNELSSSE